jgi:ABC-type transport system involved in multi-copper enzyme maturation permease subunit
MLGIIVEKEIRDLLGSTKFAITFAACAVLVLLAFYVGAARHNLHQARYEASQAENLRSMKGISDWQELDENRIFLPPQPLASLVSGVSNDIDRTAIVRGRGDIPTEDSRYNEDPVFAIFRFIDLEFIFKVVLSLFAILLGYDAVSGEKERGTLRLSFANPLPRRTYIAGKLIGAFLGLTVCLMTTIALGILILPLMGIILNGEEWIKLILVIITGLLYFGVFLTLSIFISTLTGRSANSFLISLAVWVLCIHIIPGVSVLMAARSVKVPSSDEIAYKKSTLGIQLAAEFDDGMGQFTVQGNADPEELMSQLNTYIDSLNDVRDMKMQALASRLNEDRSNRRQTQEKLAFNLARISPATSLSLATSHLAGTSLALKNRFANQSRLYQGAFGEFMVEKTGMNTGGLIKLRTSKSCGGGDDEEDEEPKPINPEELPKPVLSSITFAESIYPALTDITVLIIYNFVFFSGAFIAFMRYDLR